MKKILSVFLCVLMILSLPACNNTQPPSVSDTSTPEATDESTLGAESNSAEDQTSNNALIAYFTVPESDGVDAMSSASRVVVDGEILGSTQFIAQAIQQTAGGDLFAIETVQEYPRNHEELLDFADEERAENTRPKLSTKVENMDGYDVIFLGYPNWWADMPMPLYTFLEEYDLSGKTIIPFTTHGGSGFSNTIRTIEKLQPNATVVTDGFTVSRNSVADAGGDVKEWVQNLGITE